MIKRAFILTLSAGLLAPAAPLAAQAWDAPSFLTPWSRTELGLSLTVPDDADWGLVGYFRKPRVIQNAVNLGFTAGYLRLEDRFIEVTVIDENDENNENDDEETIEVVEDDDRKAGIVGLNATGPLMSTEEGDRVDMAWSVGLGGTFGDDVGELRIPIGVTAGVSLPLLEGLTLYPYVYPRIGIDVDLSGSKTRGDTGLSIDVGTDLGIGRNILLRLAGTVVDRSAWGIGLAWIHGPSDKVSAN